MSLEQRVYTLHFYFYLFHMWIISYNNNKHRCITFFWTNELKHFWPQLNFTKPNNNSSMFQIGYT